MNHGDDPTRLTKHSEMPTQVDQGLNTTPMDWGSQHSDNEAKQHQHLRIDGIDLLEEIGRGGMGLVYRARQHFIDRDVAVKVLFSHLLGNDEQYRARFRREAKILASFQHPHIVACYQAGVIDSGDCYMVMEFVQGSNLRQYVEERGVLSEDFALQLCGLMAEALGHAAEQGIIHRDVKPDNILLCERNGEFIPKLADLGLARPVQAEGDLQLTGQGMILGTPSTMAPEQFDDPDSIDERADMYGLGCVLFFALTGENAFNVHTGMSRMVADKVTGHFRNLELLQGRAQAATLSLIKRLLSPHKDQRFANYSELIAAIDDCRRQATRSPAADVKIVRNLFIYVSLVALVVCAGMVALVLVPQPGEKIERIQPTSTADVSPEPDETTSVTAEVAATILPIEAEQHLWDSSQIDPFQGRWQASAPSWGLAEEIPQGIIGFTAKGVESWLAYPHLPAGNWEILITYHPQNIPGRETSEAGIFIQADSQNNLVGVLFQHLTGVHMASQLRFSSQGERLIPEKTVPVAEQESYQLKIVQNDKQVTFYIDEKEFFSDTLSIDAPSLGLYVQDGAAGWSSGLIRPLLKDK